MGREEIHEQSNAEKNKAIVLEAFGTLFNKRDYVAAEVTARYIGDKLSLAFAKDKKSAIQIYVGLNP